MITKYTLYHKSIFLLFVSMLHISCSIPEQKNKPEEIQFAFGYLENTKRLTDEVCQVFKNYLPSKYMLNPLYLKSSDINFTQKDVVWHLGMGSTVFALKELSEGIRFTPLMWETGYDTSVQIISKKEEPDLKKVKKILVYHRGYASALVLTRFYDLNLDNVDIFETSDEKEALMAFKIYNMDVVATEVFFTNNPQINRIIDILKFEDKKLSIKNFTDLKIPVRTLFYSPKLSEADKDEVVKTLIQHPWKNQQLKLAKLISVDQAAFQKVEAIFNWKLDNKIRGQLKKL